MLANIRGNGGGYWFADWFAPWSWIGTTHVDLVDASNKAEPAITEQVTIDGTYINSRRIGNLLYLVTRHTPTVDGVVPFAETEEARAANQTIINEVDISDIMPKIRYSDGSEQDLVSVQDCFVPATSGDGEIYYYPTVTTITALDLTSPGQFDSLCMAEGVSGMHMSLNALYLSAFNSPGTRPDPA